MNGLERLFHRGASFAVRRPRRVLAGALVLAAAALVSAAFRLELKTSNLDLIDRDLPEVRRFLEVARDFGTPNVLVVVFEGGDAEALRRAVDLVGPRIAALPGVRSVVDRLPLDPDVAAILKRDVYLHSRDDGLFFLFVQPEDAESQATTIAPFVEGVRRVLAEADLERLGVRGGLTGMPAYAIDDRDVVQKDISSLSLVAFAAILGLFAAAFRDLWRPLAAMGALGIACTVVLGWVSFVPGHLTLLSAFFASILFGLGVDSGIHVLDRLAEETAGGRSQRDAIPDVLAALGRPLTTSTMTSASVLLAMRWSGFLGFAELGTIAGVGLILCLAATVLVLPALLVLVPEKRRARFARRGRVVLAVQSPWAAAALGVAACAALFVPGPGFDTDYLDLEPRGSEAVRLEREMVRRSDHSPELAVFTAGSREELQDLVWRLYDDETVGSVRSLLDLEVYGVLPELPASFLQRFRGTSGRYAVYVSPGENIWDPEHQEAFLSHMKAIDPGVSGMPVLGQFMVERSQRALRIAAVLGAVLLAVWVLADFRRPLPALLAVLPALLALAAMNAMMRLVGVAWNPLNVMALPIVLGISVDDGVHVVHRFLAEGGDLKKTLAGTGRSVVLTSATTLAAFGALGFASHRGLASFAIALVLGVSAALVLSVAVLPQLLRALRAHPGLKPRDVQGRRTTSSPPRSS